jgi:hypothetical protein
MAGTIQEGRRGFNPRPASTRARADQAVEAAALSGTGGWESRSMKAMPRAERMKTVWITVCRMMPVTV